MWLQLRCLFRAHLKLLLHRVEMDISLWASEGTRKGMPIDINVSLDPGFRRGEGGWEAGLGAFLVARGWGGTAPAS